MLEDCVFNLRAPSVRVARAHYVRAGGDAKRRHIMTRQVGTHVLITRARFYQVSISERLASHCHLSECVCVQVGEFASVRSQISSCSEREAQAKWQLLRNQHWSRGAS